jgi:hypothetical protein
MNRIRVGGWWGVETKEDQSSLRRRRDRLRLRPALLILEGRQLLATIDVTNSAASGAGSLAAAIARANTDGQANAIEFTGAVFKTGQTIKLGSSGLELSDTTGKQEIEGSTAGVTIDAKGSSNVLCVDPDVKAMIAGLTLEGAAGSGFSNSGTANVSDCTMTHNRYGVVNNGTLTISGSTITNNSDPGKDSGGVQNSGSLTATHCTISDNSDGGNGTGAGAGGFSNVDEATASLSGCTITGNSATGLDGGGVDNGGNLTMTRCTINDNSAADGGGLATVGGEFTLTDCTISNNSATSDGGGAGRRSLRQL